MRLITDRIWLVLAYACIIVGCLNMAILTYINIEMTAAQFVQSCWPDMLRAAASVFVGTYVLKR